jgi:hypothetical protein
MTRSEAYAARMSAVCPCGNPARQWCGNGRPTRYCSGACNARAYRQRVKTRALND